MAGKCPTQGKASHFTYGLVGCSGEPRDREKMTGDHRTQKQAPTSLRASRHRPISRSIQVIPSLPTASCPSPSSETSGVVSCQTQHARPDGLLLRFNPTLPELGVINGAGDDGFLVSVVKPKHVIQAEQNEILFNERQGRRAP